MLVVSGSGFEDLAILEEGTEGKLVGVNPERNWGKFEVQVKGEMTFFWLDYGVVDLVKEDEEKLVEVPPTPIPTERLPVPKQSSDYKT